MSWWVGNCGFDWSCMGKIGIRALKPFEWEIVHLERHYLVFQQSRIRKSKQHIAQSQCSPRACRARERRKTWKLLLEQMSTRWHLSTFWTQVPFQGCRCRLRSGGWCGVGSTHSNHQKVCVIFLGTRDSLLQDASFQAEDTGVPSSFAVDWQPGWGGGQCVLNARGSHWVSEFLAFLQRQEPRPAPHWCSLMSWPSSSPWLSGV